MVAGPSAMEVDGAGPLLSAAQKATNGSGSYELPWVRLCGPGSYLRLTCKGHAASCKTAAHRTYAAHGTLRERAWHNAVCHIYPAQSSSACGYMS